MQLAAASSKWMDILHVRVIRFDIFFTNSENMICRSNVICISQYLCKNVKCQFYSFSFNKQYKKYNLHSCMFYPIYLLVAHLKCSASPLLSCASIPYSLNHLIAGWILALCQAHCIFFTFWLTHMHHARNYNYGWNCDGTPNIPSQLSIFCESCFAWFHLCNSNIPR